MKLDIFDDDDCRFPIAAEHVTDGSGLCWCEPAVEVYEGAHIVIHKEPAWSA